MSRTAHSSKIKVLIIGLVVALLGVGGEVWYNHDHASLPLSSTAAVQSPPKTDNIKYQGEEGKTALELLKTHAKVQTKTSSLGDYVTFINDNDGGGKKYWLFYVNGKEADVGAGAYITHSTDNIEWKLQ